jgi:hypothetical protein
MKALIALLLLCVRSIAQGTGPATLQGTCNATNTGNNSTVTVTCNNVDKKLADQIRLLVAASKRDGKTLKDISDKIDVLLKEAGGPTIQIEQQNNAPNTRSYAVGQGNLTVNEGPESRLLTPADAQRALEILGRGPVSDILLMQIASDGDGPQVIAQLAAIFTAAHWNVMRRPMGQTYFQGMDLSRGIHILANRDDELIPIVFDAFKDTPAKPTGIVPGQWFQIPIPRGGGAGMRQFRFSISVGSPH